MTNRAQRLRRWTGWLALPLLLAGCGTIEGSASDPGDSDAVLSSLKPYFSPDTETKYFALQSEAERRTYRNQIVLLRMRAYDIEYDRFARQLWGSSNLTGAGSDLAVLILAGVGATTGNLATKTAAAAASAGIVGFQGAISKDIYFQRTLPALLSQIEANRDTAKLAIVKGLKQTDAEYSLLQAELDLQALQRAASIASAVSDITGQASTSKSDAHAALVGAQFEVGVVAADQQPRRVAISTAIRAIGDDKTKLDKVATALGVTIAVDGTARKERNDILAEVLKAQTKAQLDAMAAKLQPVLNQEF